MTATGLKKVGTRPCLSIYSICFCLLCCIFCFMIHQIFLTCERATSLCCFQSRRTDHCILCSRSLQEMSENFETKKKLSTSDKKKLVKMFSNNLGSGVSQNYLCSFTYCFLTHLLLISHMVKIADSYHQKKLS